jgi:hypothetical protein
VAVVDVNIALTPVGDPGAVTAAGEVTALEKAPYNPYPFESRFFAFTANLYAVLGMSPEIAHDPAAVDMQVPSGVPVASVAFEANAAAVYSVIGSPPFSLVCSNVHVTFAVVVEKVAVGEAG